MKRRTFLGRTASALVAFMALGSSALLTGCAALTDLLNWIPVGLSAVSSILTLLSSAGIVLGPQVVIIIGLIQSGLTDLRLAIVEYNSTTPPPVGALAKIDTFLSDLVSNIGSVLDQLPGGVSKVIELVIGLFELLLSTIQGFIEQIPMAASSTPKTKAAMNHLRGMIVNGKPLAIGPRPRNKLTRRSYIHDHNALCNAAGESQADLPESLIQHL